MNFGYFNSFIIKPAIPSLVIFEMLAKCLAYQDPMNCSKTSAIYGMQHKRSLIGKMHG